MDELIINKVKLLTLKVNDGTLTIIEANLIFPDYGKYVELVDLIKHENVESYLLFLETPEVKRYLELTRPTGKGHVGPKNPMPCRLCGQDSHTTSWAVVKINGLNHWVGTMKETCPKFEGNRFQIPMESDKEVYDQFPLSIGQQNGRSKIESEKGYTKTSDIKE